MQHGMTKRAGLLSCIRRALRRRVAAGVAPVDPDRALHGGGELRADHVVLADRCSPPKGDFRQEAGGVWPANCRHVGATIGVDALLIPGLRIEVLHSY